MGMIERNIPVFKMEKYGSIYDICITKEHRHQNIGEMLVREVKKWYKSRGISRVHVQVASANPISTSFWRKMGFTPFMERMYFNS